MGRLFLVYVLGFCLFATAGGPNAEQTHATYATQTALKTDMNMVVAFDRSESITRQESITQIQGLIYALQDPEIQSSMLAGHHGRIGLSVIKWSSFARHAVLLPWHVIDSRQDMVVVERKLQRLIASSHNSPDGSQTDLGSGIGYAHRMLADAPYTAHRQVINIVGDGPANIGHLPVVDRDAAVADGITINALLMTQGTEVPVLRRYFTKQVIGGPAAFVHNTSQIGDFPEAMRRKMLLEITQLIVPNNKLR